MHGETNTRRDLLLRCAALGVLKVAPPLTLETIALAQERSAESRKATPWNEIGPYYKRKAPNNSKLRPPGEAGMPVAVSGRVFDTRANSIRGAVIEIWHADHRGHYDLDGYRHRAALTSDASGSYSFDSTMPGHYPARVCQHIHYLVKAPGCKPLTTQLYFATDPVFDGDPARNYARDPLVLDRELIRPVMLKGDPGDVIAAVTFELVLERL
jgi:protocatechuate 3,4-dioxygenase beta subunit